MNSQTRKFFSYYKPYKGLLFADLACALVVAGCSLLLPLLTRYITKDVLEAGMLQPARHIYSAGAGMLALIALESACMFFYDYRGHAMGAMMERDMRAELFAKYQQLSFSYHDGQSPGRLMSRLTNDLLSLAELYHHGPEDLVINSVKFIGAVIILFFTHAALTWAVLAFLPLIAVFTLTIGRRMNAAMKENLARIGDVHAVTEENLSGIRVVQSFAAEAAEEEKFARENNRHLDSRKNIYRHEAYFSMGVNVFTRLVTAAVVVFGGIGITRASLDLADLLTFVLYVGYLTAPVMRLAFTIKQYQEGIAGFTRFTEVLAIAPDVADAPDARALPQLAGHVAFRGVGFRYGEAGEAVLRDVTLDVRPGELVAIVGHSGVGKTTLCSLIPRFYDATEGAVLVDGIDVRSATLASLRRQVGVVAQDVYLFSGSVMENIRYGDLGATDGAVMEAARRAGAHDFIMALPEGYATDIGHRGIRLSGGQKQRLSIARAFLKNPPILIMDEATSALDTESERIVQASLEALAKNRTTFVIAHRLSTIRHADRIIVLSAQGVAEEGSHEALLERGGVYAGLYAAQPLA